jgi:hypothetical protein
MRRFASKAPETGRERRLHRPPKRSIRPLPQLAVGALNAGGADRPRHAVPWFDTNVIAVRKAIEGRIWTIRSRQTMAPVAPSKGTPTSAPCLMRERRAYTFCPRGVRSEAGASRDATDQRADQVPNAAETVGIWP